MVKAMALYSVCQMSGLVRRPSPICSARPIRMNFAMRMALIAAKPQ